jgi:outer membrane lipoprotein SlyB
MSTRKIATYLITLAFLGACASHEPIIDKGGAIPFDEGKYQQDLKECQAYAEKINPAGEAIAGALLGALFGAALGSAAGAATGAGAGYGATVGTAVMGTTGAAAGVSHGAGKQVQIINNCLIGRGYRVLG